MFSPACSPAWSATEPSWGSTFFVFVSVIHAMSPTANTSGWPARLRSGSTGTRFPRCSSTPSDWAIGFACRPAPQTSVCAGSTVPDFSVTRVGAIDATASPRTTSTPRFSSACFVYVRMSCLNIEKSAGPASTRVSRAFSCGMRG